MSSLLRPLAVVACLLLVQGLLYVLVFMSASSVRNLRSEVESVNTVSYGHDHYKESHNRTEWQALKDSEKLLPFKEEVNRDLLDKELKLNGLEMWTRNTSMLLETVRHWNGSKSISNEKKRINDSIDEDRFDSSSRTKTRNELMKPLEEYILPRRNQRTDFQKGLIANLSDTFPNNTSRMNFSNRPFNPLDQYFLTVRGKGKEIREGHIANPIDFLYVINPGYKTCGEEKVFLIAFVTLAVERYDFRKAIRNTWAVTSDFRLPVRYVFIVGQSTGRNADRIQQIVEEESRNFGDIVQADFLDTYNNLTYKSLMGLRWATTYCPEAKYVMKIDDDTFVNMFALLDRLEQDLNRTTFSDLKLFCRVFFHDRVMRAGKWAVAEEEFRHEYYPPHCKGGAYVLSMALASEITRNSLHVPFFRLEDVYLTGFVTMLSGDRVRFVQWKEAFVRGNAFIRVFLNRDRNKYLFAIQVNSNNLHKSIWNQMRQMYTNSTQQTTDDQGGHGTNHSSTDSLLL